MNNLEKNIQNLSKNDTKNFAENYFEKLGNNYKLVDSYEKNSTNFNQNTSSNDINKTQVNSNYADNTNYQAFSMPENNQYTSTYSYQNNANNNDNLENEVNDLTSQIHSILDELKTKNISLPEQEEKANIVDQAFLDSLNDINNYENDDISYFDTASVKNDINFTNSNQYKHQNINQDQIEKNVKDIYSLLDEFNLDKDIIGNSKDDNNDFDVLNHLSRSRIEEIITEKFGQCNQQLLDELHSKAIIHNWKELDLQKWILDPVNENILKNNSSNGFEHKKATHNTSSHVSYKKDNNWKQPYKKENRFDENAIFEKINQIHQSNKSEIKEMVEGFFKKSQELVQDFEKKHEMLSKANELSKNKQSHDTESQSINKINYELDSISKKIENMDQVFKSTLIEENYKKLLLDNQTETIKNYLNEKFNFLNYYNLNLNNSSATKSSLNNIESKVLELNSKNEKGSEVEEKLKSVFDKLDQYIETKNKKNNNDDFLNSLLKNNYKVSTPSNVDNYYEVKKDNADSDDEDDEDNYEDKSFFTTNIYQSQEQEEANDDLNIRIDDIIESKNAKINNFNQSQSNLQQQEEIENVVEQANDLEKTIELVQPNQSKTVDYNLNSLNDIEFVNIDRKVNQSIENKPTVNANVNYDLLNNNQVFSNTDNYVEMANVSNAKNEINLDTLSFSINQINDLQKFRDIEQENLKKENIDFNLEIELNENSTQIQFDEIDNEIEVDEEKIKFEFNEQLAFEVVNNIILETEKEYEEKLLAEEAELNELLNTDQIIKDIDSIIGDDVDARKTFVGLTENESKQSLDDYEKELKLEDEFASLLDVDNDNLKSVIQNENLEFDEVEEEVDTEDVEEQEYQNNVNENITLEDQVEFIKQNLNFDINSEDFVINPNPEPVEKPIDNIDDFNIDLSNEIQEFVTDEDEDDGLYIDDEEIGFVSDEQDVDINDEIFELPKYTFINNEQRTKNFIEISKIDFSQFKENQEETKEQPKQTSVQLQNQDSNDILDQIDKLIIGVDKEIESINEDLNLQNIKVTSAATEEFSNKNNENITENVEKQENEQTFLKDESNNLNNSQNSNYNLTLENEKIMNSILEEKAEIQKMLAEQKKLIEEEKKLLQTKKKIEIEEDEYQRNNLKISDLTQKTMLEIDDILRELNQLNINDETINDVAILKDKFREI